MRWTIAVAAACLVVAGCGGSGGGPHEVTISKVATAMNSVPGVTKTVQMTEQNDRNNLLGKQGQYTSGLFVFDKAGHCNDGLGVDCGATVEVFGSDADAKRRYDYIRGIVQSAPMFMEEDYLHGNVLLRVAGALERSQADALDNALTNALD